MFLVMLEGHSFCKSCLEEMFSGCTDTVDRTKAAGRTLRQKKVIVNPNFFTYTLKMEFKGSYHQELSVRHKVHATCLHIGTNPEFLHPDSFVLLCRMRGLVLGQNVDLTYVSS